MRALLPVLILLGFLNYPASGQSSGKIEDSMISIITNDFGVLVTTEKCERSACKCHQNNTYNYKN